jgi:hypothetical protein
VSENTPPDGTTPDPAGATPTDQGTPAATDGGTTGSGATPTPVQPDPNALGDAGKAALQAERKRADAAEKRAAVLEKEKKDRELAELDEAERLKTQLADAQAAREEAEKRLRDVALSQALTTAATAAGMNADAVSLAYREVADTLTLGDDGTPQGLDDAVAQLQARYPSLFGTPGTTTPPPAANVNPGAGNQPAPTVTLPGDEAAAAAAFGMTPEQWLASKNRYGDATPDPT